VSGSRVATERLYRAADGRVVFEGDVDAKFLLVAEGDEIPEGVDVPKKQAARAADKQAAKAVNKSRD
jgi:hypothetical protein